MKPARIVRDPKPADVSDQDAVTIVWHEVVDPRRLKRVAAILADILDNEDSPVETGSHSGPRSK